MPLTGELEHLPIVDVIQLIHSTRKSGTLNVYSRKGEGQLVFDNGYIVGASHSSDKIRIGQILLEEKLISQQELHNALEIQNNAGDQRKPLITTLFENSNISRDAAYKSLEKLIELTVVEMISWTRGIFTLDVDKTKLSDDYQYLPEKFQKITLDTQMVLLDALRIFDEKVHAGKIEIVDDPDEAPLQLPQRVKPEAAEQPTIELSADILGLGDLENLERKKPRVFKSLEAFDPTKIQQQIVNNTLPDLNPEQCGQLVNFLTSMAPPATIDVGTPAFTQSQAIVMYISDPFIQHALMTVCKKERILVFSTDDGNKIDDLIERAIGKSLEPILVFGSPDENQAAFSAAEITRLRQQRLVKYPQLSIIQLVSQQNYSFSLQSLNDGVRAIFPIPDTTEQNTSYVADTINFLNSFQAYLRGCFNDERRQQFARLRNSLSGLRMLRKAPDISLAVLQFVSENFARSLTLIVDKTELIAERSIGIVADKSQGPAAPLKLRIPLAENSLLQKMLKEGTTYFGPCQKDAALVDHLFAEIGAPLTSRILLLPLTSHDRVITLTYADFGEGPASRVPLDFLDFFVSQAATVMENALYRKQLGKYPRPTAVEGRGKYGNQDTQSDS